MLDIFLNRTKNYSTYLKGLLAGSVISIASLAYAEPGGAMTQATGCSVGLGLNAFVLDWPTTISNSLETSIRGLTPNDNRLRRSNVSNSFPDFYSFELYSDTPPTFTTLTPLRADIFAFNEPAISSGESVVMFLILGATPQNGVCTYQYTLSFNGTTYTRTMPTLFKIVSPEASNPAAVPIFNPIGIIIIISGLFWFGRRYSIKN